MSKGVTLRSEILHFSKLSLKNISIGITITQTPCLTTIISTDILLIQTLKQLKKVQEIEKQLEKKL